MPENLKAILEHVTAKMENARTGVVVVDRTLKCCWANAAALRRYPTLAFPDGIIDLFAESGPEAIIKEIGEGIPFTKDLSVEPVSTAVANFSPLISEGNICGCIIFIENPFERKEGDSDHAETVISAFSNEYKMPLTIMFSTLGLMARRLDQAEDETMKDYLRLVTHNCYRILRLSDNITEIARYRSGMGKLSRRNGDINRFFTGLCSATAVLTASINIPLTFEVPDEALLVSFDPKKLSEAFLNLISNSCKYTRPGNQIRVKVEGLEHQLVVTVADKGVGIKPELLQRVFKPYYSHNPEGGPVAGAGLGLSLARYIIAQHGGTMAIRSEQDVGTTVAFTMPIVVDDSLSNYLAESSADYLADRFSTLYVELADVCRGPLP